MLRVRRQHGRIFTHDRDTDNALLLGESIEIAEGDQAAMRETELEMINLTLQREYCNRIKHVYKFWEDKYPSYFQLGVGVLSSSAIADPNTFYHKDTHGLLYIGLNTEFLKAFMPAGKREKQQVRCVGR